MRRVWFGMVVAGLLAAQVPDPDVPLTTFKVNVVAKTAKAVNYRHRSGATKIDFAGTAVLPEAKGQAKVESKQGYIEIEVEFANLAPATKFGPEYLTYVLWAITPEGRATNLGEVLLNGTRSKLNVTSEHQAFGLIVTAEPYFSVTQPSDVVVLENVIRPDTVGKVDLIDAKFELLQRGNYENMIRQKMVVDPKVPLELYEARQAVQIARAVGAAKYSSDTFKKATDLLAQAEGYLTRKAGMKPVAMISREAVQTAEDSRVITIKRREEEALMNERAAAAEREAKAQAEAAAESERARVASERARLEAENARLEAERRKQADLDRQAAEKARAEAEAATAEARKLKAEAEAARAAAEKARAEAEAARQAALAQQQAALADLERAKAATAEAEKGRLRAEEEKGALRQQLLDQFNLILETRDSARGLIVNLSDVLFDFGKFTLRPPTREKLAKISGIVLAHPGLKLEVEGHTDDIGSEEFNQKLSEQRADAVRGYLVEQGLNGDMITAMGFGKTMPAVPNTNPANRQKNRRVEMVVSGEIIGTKLSSKAPAGN
ncbi:MAG: OmpA family protein [Acidobacteria bacterium]|jgi:outer membrane protein OmpA-like peptidoglycan-associated protein|nr:OmpA family protein [Acidobacteriota bacterium]